VMPRPGFLRGLREVCDRYGSVLIFDEVMTGFRVHPRGAQGLFGVTPDLTTLGKVIGGGMPVGAFGGKRAIMEKIAPLGPVYQAGTLSGNPVAVAAGLATLAAIEAPEFHERLSAVTKSFVDGMQAAAILRRRRSRRDSSRRRIRPTTSRRRYRAQRRRSASDSGASPDAEALRNGR